MTFTSLLFFLPPYERGQDWGTQTDQESALYTDLILTHTHTHALSLSHTDTHTCSRGLCVYTLSSKLNKRRLAGLRPPAHIQTSVHWLACVRSRIDRWSVWHIRADSAICWPHKKCIFFSRIRGMVELEYSDLWVSNKLMRSCGGENREGWFWKGGACCANFQLIKVDNWEWHVVFEWECHCRTFIDLKVAAHRTQEGRIETFWASSLVNRRLIRDAFNFVLFWTPTKMKVSLWSQHTPWMLSHNQTALLG